MHTASAKEIENFAKDSARWWDERGPFAPLHRLNPVRLSFIKEKICGHYKRDVQKLDALQGLSILDIGCGGGLICEPLRRLGAQVTGLDADENAIRTARAHADDHGLDINYLSTTTDDHIKTCRKYDVVLALEIVEHVTDVDLFVSHCVDFCADGGLLIFSTLNRTPSSFLLGKIAAEYILRWVPAGTHDWRKFVKPSELAQALRHNGALPDDIEGLSFNPLSSQFQRSKENMAINYFLCARKMK